MSTQVLAPFSFCLDPFGHVARESCRRDDKKEKKCDKSDTSKQAFNFDVQVTEKVSEADYHCRPYRFSDQIEEHVAQEGDAGKTSCKEDGDGESESVHHFRADEYRCVIPVKYAFCHIDVLHGDAEIAAEAQCKTFPPPVPDPIPHTVSDERGTDDDNIYARDIKVPETREDARSHADLGLCDERKRKKDPVSILFEKTYNRPRH